MPAYLVAIVDVKNVDAYMEYAKRANAACAKYGGRFLLRGVPAQVLEGVPPGNRLVVSEWESLDQARAYYNSPEYAEAKARRQGVADATLMLFDGL
jgi:uncharacterized protein (DUF1330 family)